MTEGIVGGLAILAIFCFCALIILYGRHRGKRIRLWIRPISCFPRVKRDRPMKIKYILDVVHTLSPLLCKIFDETMKSLGDTDKDKELKRAWKKIKENKSSFTIWCIIFKKPWIVAGEKGRLVFAFSLFSPEEMTHRLYRKDYIKCLLLYPPLKVHHPIPKTEWIKIKMDEAEANGNILTSELLKKIDKSYRYINKEHWISFILYPTMLSATGEVDLLERLEGFEDIFKISISTQKENATKLAKYEVLDKAVADFEVTKRELKKKINEMDDANITVTKQKQDLLHTLNMQTLKINVNSGGIPYPVIPTKKAKEAKGPANSIKKAFRSIDYIDLVLIIGIILGLPLTIAGLVTTEAIIALVSGAIFFGSTVIYLWKKRNGLPIEIQSKPQSEVTTDD